MRNYVIALYFGVLLSIGGCANNPLSVVSNPASLVTPQQKAQASIDQANASIAAAAKTILDGVNSGVYTKIEASHFFDDLSTASHYADQAQEYVAVGDYTNSANILKLEAAIVSAITADLVKTKNGGN